MSLIVLGSAKGSPGVTTLAVVLAQCWPGPAVVAECDLAGGDLAARFSLAPTPGLTGLGSDAEDGQALAWPGVRQSLPGDQAGVVVGGVGNWDVIAELDWVGLARVMADVPELVVADVGRVGAGPFEALAPVARAIVMVARRELSAVAHVRGILGWIAAAAPDIQVGLVMVGERGLWSDQEVSVSLGVPVLGCLPWVGALSAPPRRAQAPDLRPLRKAGSSIARRLGEILGPEVATPVQSPVASPARTEEDQTPEPAVPVPESKTHDKLACRPPARDAGLPVRGPTGLAIRHRSG